MSDSQENFYRSCQIVMDVIPKGLRDLFKDLWNSKYPHTPWDDRPGSGQAFLRNERSQAVRKTVNQSMIHGDSNKFDGTTLFSILLYSSQKFCQDQSNIKTNIDKLRLIRNNCFAHLPSASLTDQEYQTLLAEVKSIFSGLGWPITSVCDIEQNSISTSKVKQLEDELIAEGKRNKNLETRLGSLEMRVRSVEGHYKESEERLESIETKINAAGENLSMETTKMLAQANTEKMNSLKTDIESCNTRMKPIETMISATEIKLLSLEKELVLHTHVQEENAARIELLESYRESSFVHHDTLIDEVDGEVDKDRSDGATRIWWNVREPLPNFTGRSCKLNELHKLFKQSTVVAICGFGGIGKSELARKFAQLQSNSYSNFIWINSEKRSQVEDTFYKIADYICLAAKEFNSKGKVSFEIVRQTLYHHLYKDKCFIIFDNAEQEISYFLPSLPQASNNLRVLITSRYQEFDCPVKKVFLSVWSEADAIKFIESELPDEMPAKQEIQMVSELLGYSPLALQQAIALMKRRNLIRPFTLSDFIELYSRRQKFVLESKLPKEHDYEGTIATCSHIILEIVEQNKFGPIAKQLLFLISVLSTDDIPCSFIISMLGIAEDDILEVLVMLRNYSIITCYQKNGESFLSIHRLIRQVLLMELKHEEKTEMLQLCLERMGNKIDFPLHAAAIWNHAMENGALLKKYESSIFQTIAALKKMEFYSQTLAFLKAVCSSGEKVFDKLDMIAIQNQIADSLSDLGQYEEALDKYEAVYSFLVQELGEEHPDTLITKNNIAHTLLQSGKYREALSQFNTVYILQVKKFGEQHISVMATKHNIAYTLLSLGQYREALKVSKIVHEFRVKEFGEQHPSTLSSKLNSALNLLYLGQYQEALKSFNTVYNLRVKQLGEQHQSTVVAKNIIARTFLRLGQYKDALEAFNSVYDCRIVQLGKQHPDTLSTMGNVAHTLFFLGKYGEALEMFNTTCKQLTEKRGEQHPTVSAIKHNTAKTLRELGQYNKALRMFHFVYDLDIKTLGDQHPNTLTTKYNIAITLQKMGKSNEALPMLNEVYQSQVEQLGESHPGALDTKFNIGITLKSMERNDEALKIFSVVYNLQCKVRGKNHPNTLVTRYNIGIFLHSMDQSSKSLEILNDVYDLQFEQLGQDHPDSLTTKASIMSVEAQLLLCGGSCTCGRFRQWD